MKLESVLASKGPKVFTIGPDLLLADAAALLAQHNIGAIIVVEGPGKPVGILSERDLVREASRDPQFLTRTVSAVMTRDITCGSPSDDVEAVLQTMTNGHFRHLPVLDGGILIGVVTIGDLVKAQLNQYKGDLDTLQTQLMDK